VTPEARTLYGFLHGPRPPLLQGAAPLWTVVLWTAIFFVVGSLPVAVVLAKVFAHRDPRGVGDGNPGAANAWRVAGPVVGMLAVILEGMKGLVPVALAYWGWHVTGWAIVPIMAAPLLGSMYSPFLRGRGGKGIAVTFGVWTGLTVWRVPMLLGLIFSVLVLFVRLEDVWTLLLGWLLVLAYLFWAYPSPPVLVAGGINFGLLILRHAGDLHPPLFKPHVSKP
jgi:glycerol-3-phosphate acyltransferase PlsY